jgi:hypothetical protein
MDIINDSLGGDEFLGVNTENPKGRVVMTI